MLQIRGFAAFIFVTVLSSALWLPVGAQSSHEILDSIQRDSDLKRQLEIAQLDDFINLQTPEAMRRAINQKRLELDEWHERERELTDRVSENAELLDDKNAELTKNAGAFGKMLGRFRFASGTVSKKFERSLVSFEYTGRVEALRNISTSRSLPKHADLMMLPRAIIQEMEAQSEVKRFWSEVVFENADRETETRELIRVGAFTAVTTDDVSFVVVRSVKSETGKTHILARYPAQPGEPYRSMMKNLLQAERGDVIRVPIDRTRGVQLMLKGAMTGRL